MKALVLRALSAACRRRYDRIAPDREPRRILVYGLMGIGNMILFTPALQAIRRRFPGAEIVVLASPGAAEVLRGGDMADRIEIARPGLLGELKALRSVRRGRFDLLVSTFHGSDHPSLTALGGIPRRLGHATSPGWSCPFDGLLDETVQMEEDQHEIDRGLSLARALGGSGDGLRPVFVLGPEDRDRADRFLHEHGVPPDAPLVGIQADSWRGHPWKRWSTRRMAKVADALAERGATVLVLAAPGHEDEWHALTEAMESEPVLAVGGTGLKTDAALVERCRLTITNDSGIMHVAAALGTPVVAIYGPTDHRRTSPSAYGGDHVVLRRGVPCSPCFRMEGDAAARACRDRICLDEITADDVLEAVERTGGLTARDAARRSRRP